MSAPTTKRLILPIALAFLLFPSLSFASVSINEIFYSPQSRSWIEVYNGGEETIDLSKYKVLDSGAAINGHSISSISGGSLGPHSYAVIAKDPTTVNASVLYKAALGAKTSGDTISLKDDSGNIADSVTFTSSMGASGDGNSLQKTESGGWIAAAPTPGMLNSSTPAPSNDNATSTDDTSDSSSSGGAGSVNSAQVTMLSTHYSYLPLSAFDERENLSVGAGRTRLGSVGSPVAFKAEVSADSVPGARFSWNFGDGSVGNGQRIDHTYRHPGDYVVVLNVSNDLDQAVARTQVKIVDPELTISKASPTAIEVTNSSKYEVNLYGWRLISGDKYFEFPQDTIILPGQKVDFDSFVTGLAPASTLAVVLKDSLSKEEPVASQPIDQKAVAVLLTQVDALQSELDTLAETQPHTSYPIDRSDTHAQEPVLAVDTLSATPLLAVQAIALSSTSSTTASSTQGHRPSVVYGLFEKIKHFFGLK